MLIKLARNSNYGTDCERVNPKWAHRRIYQIRAVNTMFCNLIVRVKQNLA